VLCFVIISRSSINNSTSTTNKTYPILDDVARAGTLLISVMFY